MHTTLKYCQKLILVTALCLIAVSFCATAGAASSFKTPADCGQCHTDNMTDWNTSIHSQAYNNIVFQAGLSKMGQEMFNDPDPSQAAIKNGCIRCHAPVKALGNATSISAADTDSGVTCDFCHSVRRYENLFNGGYVSSPGAVKHGPYPESPSPAHGTSKLPLITSAEFCAMCHDVQYGVNKLLFLNTYNEWKNSPYGKKNITCQHCMMGEKENRRVAAAGPVRAITFGHTFTGANVVQGNASLAQKRLRTAATLSLAVDTKTVRPGSIINIAVKVKNSGAGHMLPTGISFLREIRLDVTAENATGEVTKIFQERFGTILENGKHEHNRNISFWTAVRIYSDNRLKPLETRVFNQTLQIPGTARGDYRIKAALTYRPVTAEAEKSLTLPKVIPVTMAAAEDTVTVSENAPGSRLGWPLWLLGGLGLIALLGLSLAGSKIYKRKSG